MRAPQDRMDGDELERTRAMLAAIVDSSNDAIITKTFDGIIRSWNGAAERLFGYTEAEAVGRPITLLIPPDRHEEERAILERLRRGIRIEHYETVRVTKDGRELDISLTISPLRDSEGNLIGASKIARDVTERKRTEAALRDSDRRKDEFLATLAHELRNPLAPIRNSLHLLRMSARGEPDRERIHEMLDRQVAMMVRLVDDLLELSRINQGKIELKRERVRLEGVLQPAIDASTPMLASAGVHLDVQWPERPVTLDGDPMRLSQVFANLLDNAAKYSDRGAVVTVRATQQGPRVRVSVRDTGVGIAPAMLERVFEPFVQILDRVRRRQQGLGIGLHLVRTLVELHGGRVDAHSEGPGQGSEFVVELPALPEEDTDETARAPAKDAGAPRHARRSILVVDDNRDSADSMCMLLRFLGADVDVAYDGRAALTSIANRKPSVVLMDLGMPDMDGFEVARRIRDDPNNREITLIALTGFGQDSDRQRSRAAGFDHHLVKPIDLSALQALLEGRESERPSA